MGRRGPKGTTAAEIEAATESTAKIVQRADPPSGLNEAGKQRWREILAELPANRFRESDLQMLKAMITAEQYVAECEEKIAEHGLIIGPSPKTNPAVRIREYNLRTIVQIQRALRLCPSTRMRQDAAGLEATTPGGQPWTEPETETEEDEKPWSQ